MIKLIIVILLALTANVWSGQLNEPPPLLPELREVYLYLKQIKRESNNHPIVTTNPDGSRQGIPGDTIYYNNSGSYKLCVNTSTAVAGTTWRCSANAFTAP